MSFSFRSMFVLVKDQRNALKINFSNVSSLSSFRSLIRKSRAQLRHVQSHTSTHTVWTIPRIDGNAINADKTLEINFPTICLFRFNFFYGRNFSFSRNFRRFWSRARSINRIVFPIRCARVWVCFSNKEKETHISSLPQSIEFRCVVIFYCRRQESLERLSHFSAHRFVRFNRANWIVHIQHFCLWQWRSFSAFRIIEIFFASFIFVYLWSSV